MSETPYRLAAHDYPCLQNRSLQTQTWCDDLVLLHGWGSASDSWQPLIPALQQIANVIALDLPGFGESESMPEFALEAVVQLIAAQLPEKCVLIGWSLGGMLAVQIAARYPQKISRLITLSANAKFVASSDYQTAMPHAVNRKFNKSFAADPHSTLTLFSGLLAQGDANERSLLKQVRALAEPDKMNANWLQALELLSQLDNRKMFSQLTQPGLHLLAEQDVLVPVAAAQSLASLHPRQQITIIPAAAHALHWSAPERVQHLIADFLQQAAQPALSKQQMAQSFSRAAASYDSVASLQRKVGEQLLQKVAPNPAARCVLDLGCGTGFFTPQLQSKFPQALVVGVDIAEGMLRFAKEKMRVDVVDSVAASGIYTETRRKYVPVGSTPASMRSMVSEQTPEAASLGIHFACADAEALPFADQSVDIIYSNFALQWCANLPRLFTELRRVLAPNGRLIFTTLGPETLHELKSAWAQVDDLVHVNQFHERASLVQHLAASNLPLLDIEQVTEVVEFEQLSELTRSLKTLGAQNVNRGRAAGLTGRTKIQAFKTAYEMFRRNNVLPATYDVFYLTVKAQ